MFGINQLFAGKKDLHVYLTEVQSKKRVPVSMALKLNKYNVVTVRILHCKVLQSRTLESFPIRKERR